MAKPQPYGSWESPITPASIVEAANKLGNIVIDETAVYWNEVRPYEKGRSVVVCFDGKNQKEITPPPYNVKSAVHEYGGAAFTVYQGTLYFSHGTDHHLYSLSPDRVAQKLTNETHKRYADLVYNPKTEKLYAIEETHHLDHQVLNALVSIDTTGSNEIKTLHTGYDFYASISLSPDKQTLAFLAWNHPLMPWDGTDLYTGKLLEDGSLAEVEKIAGGHSESIFQPRFSPDGTLFFVSDRTGFWNLYQKGEKEILPCYPLDAEFGSPQWVFGMSRYDFVSASALICSYTAKGTDFLALLDLEKKTLTDLGLSYTSYSGIQVSDYLLYFIAADPEKTPALYSYNLKTDQLNTLRKSKEISFDSSYLSKPETIEFPTEEGKTAFGFFYPPKNREFIGLEKEKPPLIVKSHGGPSAQATATLSLEIQFWTSRGFAFLDVNYGGSTGYGRAYRQRLQGNWGIVDVSDCTNGALYLSKKERVDPNRLLIKGNSSGGYTALAALTFGNTFQGGASYYGIADLILMTQDTHKFESHYLDGLVGKYPEQKARYLYRSPLEHAHNLSKPVIFFQGDEDLVVPKNQSETLFKTLKDKRIPTAYLLFKGERHGFCKSETLKATLSGELYFYRTILHIPSNEPLDPIKIENWEN
jgi:dipeptidyl aminopeptidase/acylaminoacyl peptidase